MKEKENEIEAAINIGGTGYIVARKVIIGYGDMYILKVTSNAQIQIEGSGSYFYGDKVALVAPTSASMPGILGFLGGRYYFREWSGAVNSTSNIAVVDVKGDEKTIEARAVYYEDYSSVITYTAIIVLSVVSALAAVKYLPKRLKISRFSKPKPPLKK
ncbi:MAG: hypothetical protein ACUVV4_04360 [Candidatus Bathyarchaeia archaeon]